MSVIFTQMHRFGCKELRAMAADPLKLRAIANRPEEPEPPPGIRGRLGRARRVAIVAALAIAAALAAKAVFVALNYVLAEVSITITDVAGDRQRAALTRHLGGLYLSSVKWPSQPTRPPVRLTDLVRSGQMRIFACDDQTIKVTFRDRSERIAGDLIKRIQTDYIRNFQDRQDRQREHANRQADQQLTRDRELEKRYRDLQDRLAALVAQTSGQKPLDQSILSVGVKLESSLAELGDLSARLAEIRDQMYRTRAELRRPTVQIDPADLRRAAMRDKLFAGDYRVLTVRHKMYLAAFREKLSAAENALSAVQKHLTALSAGMSRQLRLDLPTPLADNLLELNLAVELYRDQITSYRKRWETYRATMLEMVNDPEKADYDGIQTVLSKLRQDLAGRCGDLPKRMEALFGRLKSGVQGSARKPGGLSLATVRNIACSAVQYDLEQVVAAWNALTGHIDRMFPESNVKLRMLGKTCRSLQARLARTHRQISQRLERKAILAAKRRAQETLDGLESDFQQASAELTAGFEALTADHQILCKLTKTWPQWQQLNRQIDTVALELKSAGRIPPDTGPRFRNEQVTAGEIEIRHLNHAGLFGRYQNVSAGVVGLIVAVLCGHSLGLTSRRGRAR